MIALALVCVPLCVLSMALIVVDAATPIAFVVASGAPQHAPGAGPTQSPRESCRCCCMPRFLRPQTYRARELRAHATAAEIALWAMLRGRALGAKFRRQHPLGPYIVDFFCGYARLVVEVDGDVHDTPRACEHDAQRDAFLRMCGLRVVRLRNEIVLQTPERALEIIRGALADEEPPPSREGVGGG